MNVPSGSAQPTQFAALLDERPLSSLQIRTLFLCGLVAFLDGTDTQAIGLGAPSIAAALHIRPGEMAPAITGSLFGAMIGALLFGWLGDRFGRKRALIVSVLLFSVFTVLTPEAMTFNLLVVFRVLAGIGLGGATPCFLSISTEYTPPRIRSTVVSLIWAAFPLGLLLGGFGNAYILAHYQWQTMFYVGGAVPLVTALALCVLLPESITSLTRAGRVGDARRIATRMMPGAEVTGIGLAEGMGGRSPGIRRVMAKGRGGRTAWLWAMIFMCFGTTATTIWVPTLLHERGVSPAAAAVAASFLGFGALLGMSAAGRLIDRFGALRVLLPSLLVGALSTAGLGYGADSVITTSLFTALIGGFVGMGAAGAIALAAAMYPEDVRSTGLGWLMAMGRFGQVVCPALFGILLNAGLGAGTGFLVIAAAPLIAAFAVVMLRPVRTGDGPQPAPVTHPANAPSLPERIA